MRWIAALSMLTLFGATPGAAQDRDVRRFEGTSVTVIAGVDGANRYSDWNAGAIYGGQIGHDWQGEALTVGIEGELTGSSDRQCNTSYSTTGGSRRTCVATGRDLYAGGRIGTLIGPNSLLYGKIGYTNLRQTFDVPAGVTLSSVSGTTDGVRVGGGVERRLAGGITLKAEYRYSNYAGSYDRHQGVLGVGVRF